MSDTQYYLANKKVMVVGNDIKQLDYFQKSFLCAGAKVDSFASGLEGVKALDNEKPDLLILDSTLSELSPQEMLKQVRENQETKELPVLLMLDTDTRDIKNTNKTRIIIKSHLKALDIFKIIEELLVSEKPNEETLLDISESTKPPTNEERQSNEVIKVLVLEDDPLLRDLLSTKLSNEKIPYKLWHSGNGVIEVAKKYNPTVIILDITLPEKNGLDVLSELREVAEFNKLPVIVFSNNDDPKGRMRARELGVDNFLVKAMTDLNDLMRLLLKVG